jgi:hypothetical protein
MTRAGRWLYWLTPMLFCLGLYWFGLMSWFSEDDFAWLNLRNHVVDFHSFLWAMFAPLAQGTIRPLSERGFFMVFTYFFGLHARAFHEWIFANQLVVIALVMLVTRKVTQSALAAFLAPILWMCSIAVVTPLAWAAAYNQVLCALFLLASFYLFIRYTETGQKGFYWALWATFLLGFGANEINVVFPAIAALYALLFARRYWLSTIPMFAVSGVYAVIHQLVRGQVSDYYYDMDYHPASLARTLGQYWRILVGVPDYIAFRHRPAWIGVAGLIVLSVALLGFASWQFARRKFLPAFFLGWFLIVLAPLLPVHNHVTDYYLFVPELGIAMLSAYAVSEVWKFGWARPLAVALVLIYAIPSGVVARLYTKAVYDRGERSRHLVQGVAYAKKIHPGKTILLENVDDELFWTSVYDSPFRILGWNDILMTPDCLSLIKPDPHFGPIDPYVLPAAGVANALHDGSAVVYAVEGGKLRNITRTYAAIVQSQPPPPLASFIQVGASHFQSQIGDGWYSIEDGFRWSGKHATVYLAGPTAPGQKLVVHGFPADVQTKSGPLRFALTIDGRPQPEHVIDGAHPEVQFEYPLPADLVGKPRIEVSFTLDRTIKAPGDERALGLAFGEFGIQ